MDPINEQYQAELRVFAYRMFGSLRETERLVEQALSLAQSHSQSHPQGGSIRSILHRIAAKICLNVLATKRQRTLPSLSQPPADPSEPPAPPESGSVWLEPFPDELYPEITRENLARYAVRESISLPFIAALQFVPPLERVVIILCDTMGWQLDLVAEVLEIGISDVTHALDQARRRLVGQYRAELGGREPPAEEKATLLSMRYLYSWETGNLDELVNRLTEGVILQIPPSPSWYQGSNAVRRHMATYAFGDGRLGRWRLLPRRANGQLAFGVYERDEVGQTYRAHSIQVLTSEGDFVSEIISFANPSLFPAFKLKPQVIVQGRTVLREMTEQQDDGKSFI